MTIRYSTGVRNALAHNMGLASIFNRGSLRIFTGAQPISADAAQTGTLLGTVTDAGGSLTQETPSTGTIQITGGSTSITDVTVGGLSIIPDGAVPYNGSVNQTASDLCDAINRNGIMLASVSTDTVTIKPRPGAGATMNGETVATTGSVTTSCTNMTGGVAPVNGLKFDPIGDAGVFQKLAAQQWKFTGVANGTAGWFRLIASVADAGSLASGAPWPMRIDGSIAVSGADLNLSNIAITIGAPSTIDTFKLTYPAS